MISLPAIEAVLAPHLAGDSDEGPVFAIESVGAGENPEIVLFSCRPARRDQVNEWLRDAGLSPLHYVAPRESPSPGARHRQDGLQGAQGSSSRRAAGRVT